MILKSLWPFLENKVFPFISTDLLWNPYNGEDPQLDIPNAAKIRRNNLKNYLQSITINPAYLLIGEAPGPWGCRFSGIPFTSERQLQENSLPFSGASTSTLDRPALERSATIMWRTLEDYHPNFMLWNCIPYHPYKNGQPLTIRTPSKSETLSFSALLKQFLTIINPEYIIAVGRKSETSLRHLGFDPIYVRHPSHGGSKEFEKGIRRFVK